MSIYRTVKKFIKTNIPGIRILLYHRVTSVNNDPQLLCVTPEHFIEQLEVLKKKYRVLDLEETVTSIINQKELEKTIIITFDDGYADNLYQAKPILEKYDMPATIFVVSGQVGLKQEFWWDDLARIFIIQPTLPGELKLEIHKKCYLWDLESNLNIDSSILNWDVLNNERHYLRQRVYIEITKLMKTCSYSERIEIMNAIYQWAGLDSIGRKEFRVMDENELRCVSVGGLIKVGSHTQKHVSLSNVDEDIQLNEISESKKLLEEILNKKITLFSYPFGGKKDYSQKTIDILKSLDFRLACSNFPNRVYRTTDQFQLPRFLIRDWDGDTFNQFLSDC
jgi:peptidoglycan/xylan/chitin deacetylase (PgdA/CDA1 family)